MKRQKLKTPEDYQIFSFRIAQDQKDALNALVETVVDLYNKKKRDDEKMYRKNDIIIEALEKGLDAMKRAKSK